jgi:quinol-cytochrome oxidoreductase complex cytochrome b subunit
VRSAKFRPIYRQFFWLFLIDCLVLGYIGAKPPEGAYLVIGQIATLYYFLHFLVVIPLVGLLETPKPLPASISEPVLR